MLAHGPLAASVPGIVRGWERLHAGRGKLEWASLFADAIELAENGHPLSRVLANGLNIFPQVATDPALKALYMPGGVALKPGTILKQPALAKALRAIARDGSKAYYEGWIGKSIGDYSQANGGLLSAKDFAGYEPEWVEPLATDYRGLTVRVMPPNSFGILMLMQLNAISGVPAGVLTGPDADRLACLIAAARAAFPRLCGTSRAEICSTSGARLCFPWPPTSFSSWATTVP